MMVSTIVTTSFTDAQIVGWALKKVVNDVIRISILT